MQRAAAVVFSLWVWGAAGLGAQTAVHPQDKSVGVAGSVFRIGGMDPASPLPPPMAGVAACPVQMQARQGSGRGLLVARDGPVQDKNGSDQPSQRIHLFMNDGKGKHIVQARVLAQGFGPRGRMQNTLASQGEATTVSRTLVVRMKPENKDSAAGDMVLPGFTSVQTIQLLALRYDDGTSWNALLRAPCSVTPDLLMLVDGH